MTDTTFKVPEMHCGHCKPANHRSRSGPRRPPTATRLNNELLPLANVLEGEFSEVRGSNLRARAHRKGGNTATSTRPAPISTPRSYERSEKT
jgi:hypothetical protein